MTISKLSSYFALAVIAALLVSSLGGCDTTPYTLTEENRKAEAASSPTATAAQEDLADSNSSSVQTNAQATSSEHGSLIFSRRDVSVGEKQWWGVWAPSSFYKSGHTYTAVVIPNSGDPDLHIKGWDGDDWRSIRESQNYDLERDESFLTRSDLQSDETYGAFWVRGWKASTFDIKIYEKSEGEPSVGFPTTVIQSKYSESRYATDLNAFGSRLAGECTWYAYGRVIELTREDYLDESAEEAMRDAFWGESGRHAKNWPDMLEGRWVEADRMPRSERRAGMLVAWKGGDFGHVAFIEEVSEDGERYRISDFNRRGQNIDGDGKYRDDDWFGFNGTGPFRTMGYPVFRKLPLE